ncbi:MAG: preprotein translocase subunit SecG [Clostridia bacterium]|nr:preprotein translocase subunit SecG [Clostridia bacterium]
MQTALIIIHVIISLVLIAVVLMQHGKQQGLSGAIAGGAETFFGKNKGRTIDAALKKVTAVVALLFVASSIALATYSINTNKADENAEASQQVEAQLDEQGNLVDAEGNILMTAEDVQKAQAEASENAQQDTGAKTE